MQLHFVGHSSLSRRTARDKTGANIMTEAWLIEKLKTHSGLRKTRLVSFAVMPHWWYVESFNFRLILWQNDWTRFYSRRFCGFGQYGWSVSNQESMAHIETSCLISVASVTWGLFSNRLKAKAKLTLQLLKIAWFEWSVRSWIIILLFWIVSYIKSFLIFFPWRTMDNCDLENIESGTFSRMHTLSRLWVL